MMYTSSFVRSVYLLGEDGISWGSGQPNADTFEIFTVVYELIAEN
ncbi:hypothetical protein M6D81_21780 [Paenibacillus sp. J5C_2022]|nr:hypothetical protein [Paenibacillus sp. J5C2022]